jgi:hypothetical protein
MTKYIVDPETGHWLSQDHLRIAEIIYDYNPHLELVWIPSEARKENDKDYPFAVRCNPTGEYHADSSYIVFQLREDEVDHRVLSRLWLSDNTKHDVLARIEAEENAIRAVEYKKEMEEAEERRELMTSIFKSPKSVYRHNGIEYRE